MTDVNGRGFFWCAQCQEDYPDSIQQRHMERHAEAAKPVSWEANQFTAMDVLFWTACIVVGAIAGAVVGVQ